MHWKDLIELQPHSSERNVLYKKHINKGNPLSECIMEIIRMFVFANSHAELTHRTRSRITI